MQRPTPLAPPSPPGRCSLPFLCPKYSAAFGLADSLSCGPLDNAHLVLYGLYAPQLAWWLSFFPKEQLHIMHADYLSSSMSVAMAQAFQFLGLPDMQPSKEEVERREAEISFHMDNSTDPLFDPDTYVEAMNALYEFFEPLNNQLYSLLDYVGVRDFPKFATRYIASRQ